MNLEVESILRKFNAAFCIYELAGYHSPLNVTADFAYVRLHGPDPGKYQGSYSEGKTERLGPPDRKMGGRAQSHLSLFRQRPGWLRRHKRPGSENHGSVNMVL
jgi:hypothetical protein